MKRTLFSGAIAAGCLALSAVLTSSAPASDVVAPMQAPDTAVVSTSVPVQTVGWRRGYYGGYYSAYPYGTYYAPYTYGTYYRPYYYRPYYYGRYYAPYRGYYRGWY
jgi:hypothetical protein